MASHESIFHSDREILDGEPIFVGTRVPVRALFDCLEGGSSLEGFLEQHPSVTRERAIAILGLAKERFTSLDASETRWAGRLHRGGVFGLNFVENTDGQARIHWPGVIVLWVFAVTVGTLSGMLSGKLLRGDWQILDHFESASVISVIVIMAMIIQSLLLPVERLPTSGRRSHA